MAAEMIQVKTISESRLDEIAAEIGASFYDYPYETGEGGLKALIPSREAMNAYMKALVRAGSRAALCQGGDAAGHEGASRAGIYAPADGICL